MVKYRCVDCGWETTNATFCKCIDCEDAILLGVPEKMDFELFSAIIYIVRDYYYLDAILTRQEDAVEIFDSGGERIFIVRNLLGFRRFFGEYFYRQCFEKED